MNDLKNNHFPGRYTVPALERGLRLLSEFSCQEPVLSPPELARRLGLPRSTLFRLLTTLEELGFVERLEGGNSYRLGIAVLRLGFEYLSSLQLTELGMPILGRLRDKVGYACNLVVRDARSIVYVAKVAPASWIASSVAVGARLPAYATIFGRVLLAELPLEKLREIYPESEFQAYTHQTPTSVLALFKLLQEDAQRPYISGEGFFEKNISTVAAPVRDQQGKTVAALGITLPSPSIEMELHRSLTTHVCAAAEELSSALGYSNQARNKNNVINF